MPSPPDVFQRVLREAPGSIRELAREAGVNETLLRKVRDGKRRLTRETQQAVVNALQRWSGRCEELARALERYEPNSTPTQEAPDE